MSDESNDSESPAGVVENIGEQVASGLEGAAEGMAGASLGTALAT